MIVLGLDVGSRETGIALLDIPDGALSVSWPSARARLLGAAKLEIGPTLEMVNGTAGWVELVVIEPPGQVHPGIARKVGPAAALSISKAIAEATKLAGRLLGRCEAIGLRTIEVPATEWRHRLIGKNNAKDADVTRVLDGRLDWGGHRANADKRDAAGAALWGAIKVSEEARQDDLFARIRAASGSLALGSRR